MSVVPFSERTGMLPESRSVDRSQATIERLHVPPVRCLLELYSFVQPSLLLHLPETSLCRASRRSVGSSLGSIAFVIHS